MAIKGLTRWEPFSELLDMQRDMDRLFERFMGREPAAETGYGEWTPMVESYMKGNDLVFKCELPGVDSKDVDVSYDENTHHLIIKGERKKEKETKDEDYIHREFAYGSFERRFTLPEGVKSEQLKAKYANGILEITAPAPVTAKAKKIEVETPKQIPGETEAKKKAA